MNKKETVPAHYRQGDVLVERIDALPANLKKLPRDGGRVILAHGEATGHAHAIMDAHADLYSATEPDVTYLEVRDAVAALTHDEHSTIPLAPGAYRVVRQREYSPEAIRHVAD